MNKKHILTIYKEIGETTYKVALYKKSSNSYSSVKLFEIDNIDDIQLINVDGFQSLERICLKKHYIELKELSDFICEFVDKKEEFVLRKKLKLTKNNFIQKFLKGARRMKIIFGCMLAITLIMILGLIFCELIWRFA